MQSFFGMSDGYVRKYFNLMQFMVGRNPFSNLLGQRRTGLRRVLDDVDAPRWASSADSPLMKHLVCKSWDMNQHIM